MNKLETLNDLDWFDAMCEILVRDGCPTTAQLSALIGTEDTRFSRENRGSKFLIPFDKRFRTACINPDLDDKATDQPIGRLSFGGTDFTLKMSDVLQRFSNYKLQANVYDGGTQIFFYPIDNRFEFSGLSFNLKEETEGIPDVNQLAFHHVIFHFGHNLLLARDGYHLRR